MVELNYVIGITLWAYKGMEYIATMTLVRLKYIHVHSHIQIECPVQASATNILYL